MSDDTHAMLRAILAATDAQEHTFNEAMQALADAVRGLQHLVETGFQEVLTALDGNGNGEEGK
jgi:copper homeostasis protein CutC